MSAKVWITTSSPDSFSRQLKRRVVMYDPLHAELIGYEEGEDSEEDSSPENDDSFEQSEIDREAEEAQRDERAQERENRAAARVQQMDEDRAADEPGPSDEPGYSDSDTEAPPEGGGGGGGGGYGGGESYVQPPTFSSVTPMAEPQAPAPGPIAATADIAKQAIASFQDKLANKDIGAMLATRQLIALSPKSPAAQAVLSAVVNTPPAPDASPVVRRAFSSLPGLTPQPAPAPIGTSRSTSGFTSSRVAQLRPQSVPVAQTSIRRTLSPLRGISGEVAMGGTISGAVSEVIKVALTPVAWAADATGSISKEVGKLLSSLARKL